MIEIIGNQPSELNFRQRWASYLTIAMLMLSLLIGNLIRQRVVNATSFYQNATNGISARYPASWLLTEADLNENVVFRVEDSAAYPFKTLMQVSQRISGPDERATDVRDRLNISRASQFFAYRALDATAITLPDGSPALKMNYAFVQNESNPFLQSVPIVVRGTDVIVIQNRQVLIVSFRSEAETYDQNYHYFDAFLRSLQS
jgi:hypothetical protein